MHKLTASFVLAYHGCDRAVAERLIGGEAFRSSQNDFDWLGPGIYFWEANPIRGLEFARELHGTTRSQIETPAVVGAVIDLGSCLDFTTAAGIRQIRAAHRSLVDLCNVSGDTLPRNSDDHLRRNLDCAVIRTLHEIHDMEGMQKIDSVRGVFLEGGPAFEGSGIREKAHIQICVCDPDSIKAVFRVDDRFLS